MRYMKLLKLLPLLFLFVLTTSFSQSKFSLYGNVSIDKAYSTNYFNSPSVRGKRAFGGSVYGGIYITKHIDILAGVAYTNKGYKLFREIYPIGPIDDYWYTYTYNYLEIPIAVKLKIVNKKIAIAPIVGISYGRLLSLTSENDGEKKNYFDSSYSYYLIYHTKRYAWSTNLGIEISTEITENLRARIEPRFSYTFSRLTNDLFSQDILYLLGVNIGVIKSF